MTSYSPQLSFRRETCEESNSVSSLGAVTMYEEASSDDGAPFIRHSRIVKRFHLEPSLPSPPPPTPEERYGPEFWERLMRQPSVHVSGIPGMMSSYPAWRTNCDYGSLPAPSLESLPPPSELCRSRKKKKKSGAPGYDKRAMSVQHHIQELRKKQSTIDQLKSMTWGGRSLPEMEVKEELPSDVAGMEPCQQSFTDFFDMCQTERQDGPFLDFSPQNSTSGVVFPWMTSRDDVNFSFLDNSEEGWRGAGNVFFQD